VTLRTQLTGPPYVYTYRLEISKTEEALLRRADAMPFHLLSDLDSFDGITVADLLAGGSYKTEDLLKIQVMENRAQAAAECLKRLLGTLNGFGEPRTIKV
jgi:hypothetical protein